MLMLLSIDAFVKIIYFRKISIHGFRKIRNTVKQLLLH